MLSFLPEHRRTRRRGPSVLPFPSPIPDSKKLPLSNTIFERALSIVRIIHPIAGRVIYAINLLVFSTSLKSLNALAAPFGQAGRAIIYLDLLTLPSVRL
jgi:hypothetical protein